RSTDEGQSEEQRDADQRQDQAADPFPFAREISEELEQPHVIPLGARQIGIDLRAGDLLARNVAEARQAQEDEENSDEDNRASPEMFGEEAIDSFAVRRG